MAAWSVVLGFAAILLVFRTTDWRGLIRQAQDERPRKRTGEDGAEAKAPASAVGGQAKGLPSESRQTDQRSPGWITEPPKDLTRSSAASMSSTVR